MPPLEDLLAVASQAARIGGAVLQDWASRFTAREKSPANLVTEADLASQTAIFEYIESQTPGHSFLGEEGLCRGGDSPFRWIIDPLDGTSNYVHRFPYYAVSIGLEYASELVVGVIFDPNRDELFAASLGRGATLNGKPIAVSTEDDAARAMCVASLPIRAAADHPAVRRFVHALRQVQTVQRTGSAALNLCCVACGRVDGFWSTSLNPWDQAAGALIVREAGGSVSKLDGSEFDVQLPDLLATNGTPLHAALRELLAGA